MTFQGRDIVANHLGFHETADQHIGTVCLPSDRHRVVRCLGGFQWILQRREDYERPTAMDRHAVLPPKTPIAGRLGIMRPD